MPNLRLIAGVLLVGWMSVVTAAWAQSPLSAHDQQRLASVPGLRNQIARLQKQGDFQQALEVSKKLLALRRSVLGAKHADVGASLHQVGKCQATLGDYLGARSSYEQALSIRSQTLGSKHDDTATSLNNLGMVCYKLGDYLAAKGHFERSLAYHREVLGPQHPDTGLALNNLGALLDQLGDAGAAKQYYEQALAIKMKTLGPKHASTARSLNNLGALHYTINDYPAAKNYYEQALAVRREVLGPTHPETAESLDNLANLLAVTQEYDLAARHYAQALALRQQALGKDHPDTALSHDHYGALLEFRGEFETARKHFSESLRIREAAFGAKHPLTAIALAHLGSLEKAQGNFAEAMPLLARAAAIHREQYGLAHQETVRSLGEVAALHGAEGEWESARLTLDASRRGARLYSARLLPALDEKQQLQYLFHGQAAELERSLSLGLERRGDQKALESSATWLINGKAVAHEALAERELLRREARDAQSAAAAAELQQVRRQLASLANEMPDPGETGQHRRRLQALEAQERSLAARFARRDDMQPSDPWITLDEVRRALPKPSVLVDIAQMRRFDFRSRTNNDPFGPAHYVAWIIPAFDQGEIAIVDLGPAEDLDRLVGDCRQLLASAAAGDASIAEIGELEAEKKSQVALRSLAKLVLDPLMPYFGNSTQIVLSPDAQLWLAPWAALPMANGEYALERFQFRFLTSGRDLVRTAAASVKTTAPQIFANPDYNLGRKALAAASAKVLKPKPGQTILSRSSSHLRSSSLLPRAVRLPGTAAEATAITPRLQIYAGQAPAVFLDDAAIEGAVKATLSPKVLVLSTHGYFLPEQPLTRQKITSASGPGTGHVASNVDREGNRLENPLLRCGLLFAGCNNRPTVAEQATDSNPGPDDGILTGLEIVGIDLRGAELVVLSACETGLGKVNTGEGVAGLRQAFQLAGARSVVSTLWQIPDKESAQLMTDFFGNLAQGQSKAEALRSAQLALIKTRRERHGAAHPLFWAAYTVTGN